MVIERFCEAMWLEAGLAEASVASYRRDLQLAERLCAKPLSDFSAVDVQAVLAQLLDLQRKASSMARMRVSLRRFFAWMVEERLRADDPTVLLEAVRHEKPLPRSLSEAEVERLLAAPDLATPAGLRDAAMLELLYACGLRVSELCHLTFPDLFLDEGYLRVQGKGSKQRLVPLSDSAIAEVTRYLRDPDRATPKRGQEDYVFLSRRGQAISRITVFVMVREAAEMAGVDKKISPHTFRHSFATALLEGGANLQAIQLLLGHEDVATTEIYTHIDRTKLREQVERYHPRNRRARS